jgi:hypothetical protein
LFSCIWLPGVVRSHFVGQSGASLEEGIGNLATLTPAVGVV